MEKVINELEHTSWFVNTGKVLTSSDGAKIELWEFVHEKDEVILSQWAKHFRNHYCLDDEIDYFRKGYGYSRAEYLNKIKFPDKSKTPGPSIRAGDFGEILIADFLEYVLEHWVPRTRYGDKTIRNESTKGSDIIGFKILDDKSDSPDDTLSIFEAKTQFSGKNPKPRLQDAIDDSLKDYLRKAESLNAIKHRLYYKNMFQEAERIERFQNLEDRPYKEVNGAVAIFNTDLLDEILISESKTVHHPNHKNLILIVMHGNDLMSLVHELYRRAADEA